jgi:predicted SAM-dependent methyltransferase
MITSNQLKNSSVKKANIGCGRNKWFGFLNIDADANVNPDLVLDITTERLPVTDGFFNEIWMCHTLEHLQKESWGGVFFELSRVLSIGGRLVLTYPEFDICLKYYQENKFGKRDFWEKCIFGRGLTLWDTHKAICETNFICDKLKHYGFDCVKICPEESQPQYTILEVRKNSNVVTKEDLYRASVFSGSVVNGEMGSS